LTDEGFVCVSQQAGPFVKSIVTDRAGFINRCRGDPGKAALMRCGPALSRTTLDKLELRLALFGFDGIFYTLTFADEYLPKDGEGARKAWYSFRKRLTRWNEQMGRGKLEYYVYRIEGLHGDKRLHIHCFLRDADFPPAVVRLLWDNGEVDDEPYTRKRVIKEGGYRCLARYFTKEVPVVGQHPWGTSQALARKLPPPTVHFSPNGQVRVPRDAVRLPVKDPGFNEWGVFNYVRYLLPGK